MKNTKRFLAMAASLALTACVAMTPVSASAADITINNISTTENHTFEVYQIFTGDLTSGTFTNLRWGSGISSYDGTSATAGDLVPSDTIDAITALTGTDSEKARTIIGKITPSSTKACEDVVSSGGTASIGGLADGYYLIKDVTNLDGKDDAKSAWIIQVAGTTEIAIKNSKPTVDKQVHDETDDAEAGATDGWGETADHAINESFQFKLTATLAQDPDYASYNTYRVKFNDTLNEGVTYESIESVKVNGNNVTAYVAKPDGETDTRTAAQKAGYIATEPSYSGSTIGGGSLTIEIGDIKQFLGESSWADEAAVTVEVIYNAHLNENAAVEKADAEAATTYENVNKVNLQYSNNPNVKGSGDTGDTPGENENEEEFGETPEDFVWVFTYEVENTKYKVSAVEGNELEGAGFRLYDSTGTNEIGLIYDAALGAYRPVGTGETPEEMISSDAAATKGKFNIVGLDAGDYVLKETTVPDGYNKADDFDISIGATHVENADGTAANLTFDEDNTSNNSIVDTKNNSLPSTVGMGTKLFVLGGGSAAALAGVYLISRKRTKKELGE